MPNASLDQDISFQPETKGFSYSSGPAEKKKRLSTIFVLLYLIISLSVVFFFTVIILNYFNFLPVSSMYPKFFAFLPHGYNISATENTLANVPYSQDYNGFYLEGTLVNIASNKISINYKSKLAEFVLGADLKCEKMITTKLPNGDEQQLSNLKSFCSDLLTIQNLNKQVNIIYQKDPQGFYTLDTIIIKDNK